MLQRVYTRVSKGVARYSPRGSAAEHCSACRFFMSGGDCARVLGRVLPQGWCKYFSQETVQRWNPLWQMAGIPAPPGATLDLSFLTSGSLDPRITFTRASTATYFNYAGVMQTAAANAPRWDYNPATLALNGLLIEEVRTNLVLYSADASNAAWTKNGSGAVAPTVIGNQVTAPDGTTTAARVAYPVVSGVGNFSYVSVVNPTFGAANPYAFSIWLRGNTGGEQLYLCTTPDGATYYRSLATLTTTWQRYALVTPALTAAGWYFILGTDLRDAGQTGKPAQTIYAWGAQVEQGAFPTSYIPTTAAAVSRAQDLCGIAPASMAPWFAPPGGSWAVEFICYAPFPNGARIIGQTGISAGISSAYLTSAFNGGQYDGVAGFNDTGVVTANAVGKICSTWAPGQAKVSTNAAVPATSAALTTGYGLLATSGVSFLQVASGGAFNTSGYLRRVTYWPRVLSNAEMQQVTT